MKDFIKKHREFFVGFFSIAFFSLAIYTSYNFVHDIVRDPIIPIFCFIFSYVLANVLNFGDDMSRIRYKGNFWLISSIVLVELFKFFTYLAVSFLGVLIFSLQANSGNYLFVIPIITLVLLFVVVCKVRSFVVYK